ncbi:MAG TPA: ABC transporter substrate-binding protein, partial [Kiloniellales bacterium]|nr:ABC transporter substrate-binding protein [Kiloniellales bacterium]
MKVTRREVSKLMLLSGVGALLGLRPGSAAAQANGVVRIGLPTRAYWPAVPVHAAQELGFYEKEGLAAEITIYNSGGAAMEAIAAGACDIISASPATVAGARVRGVGAKIVAAGSQTPRGFYVIVKADSPYQSMQDLAGKNLGITAAGSTTDFLALWAIEHSATPMTKVAVGGGSLIPNLLSDQLDAIVAYPPLSYTLLSTGEGRAVLDYGAEMEPCMPDTWVGAEQSIRDRPATIEATLRAIFGALRHIQNDRAWGLEFVQRYTQLSPEVAVMEYERTLLPLPTDGELQRAWIETSMRLAKLAGLTDLPPVDEMFTTAFTPLKT